LAKTRGAEAVFDYNYLAGGQILYEYTNGELQLVWDTIDSEKGIEISMEASR
jgi:hypothetical protein